jgi:hypothetical protein
MKGIWAAALAGGLLLASPAAARSFKVIGDDFVNVIGGDCGPPSSIAEGKRGDDLTKVASRYYCDAVVWISFGDRPGHMMFQFSRNTATHTAPVAFAGQLKDHDFIDVRTLYLEPGRGLPTTDGGCKMFWKAKKLTNIVCFGVVDEGPNRTVASASFAVAPGEQ